MSACLEMRIAMDEMEVCLRELAANVDHLGVFADECGVLVSRLSKRVKTHCTGKCTSTTSIPTASSLRRASLRVRHLRQIAAASAVKDGDTSTDEDV